MYVHSALHKKTFENPAPGFIIAGFFIKSDSYIGHIPIKLIFVVYNFFVLLFTIMIENNKIS